MQLVFGTAGTSLYILVFSPRTALIFIVFTEGLPAGCKAVLGAEIEYRTNRVWHRSSEAWDGALYGEEM